MMHSNGDFSRVPFFIRARPEAVARFMLQCGNAGLPPRGEHLASVYVDLVSQARLMTQLALCECNGIRHKDPSDPRGYRVEISTLDRVEMDSALIRSREHARKSISAIFPRGTVAEFNRDPRGAPIKLTLPDQAQTVLFIEGGES